VSNPLPDRLSVNPKSPHYNEEVLKRAVGIRFNGVERTNVEEYCVSEGWIRVAAGKGVDRRGNPLLMKISGTVEPFFKR
jgi:predicted house-cleaning NTP pyrophosphatase (Maf/HAM1 superfamily)